MSAKCLIVEDNASNLNLIQLSLEKEKIETIGAPSLEKAREILFQENICLVLLDIGLPDGSGLDLLKELRQKFNEKELPIIMITAHDESETIAEVLLLGANDYLTKPFTPKEGVPKVLVHYKIKGE